uniref:5'-nucleotidase n=1 Tax=Pyrodinium bahamense TaxID=73915 RepID=A0A7S0AHD1_9DINO
MAEYLAVAAPGVQEEVHAFSVRARRWQTTRRMALMAALVAAVVALFGAGVAHARDGHTAPRARPEAEVELFWPFSRGASAQAAAEPCEKPSDFCATNPNREDHLSYRDCDGDGVLDPYCEGGELLRFGYISSKDGCKNTWPNGLCLRPAEPGKSQGEFDSKKAASNEITIIHFNDVYQVSGTVEGKVRRGGMSRAAHVINMERKRNPDRTFVVFAGDLLSPSVLSDLFEGEQMVDILNTLKLDASSLGNHEFDFGVDTLAKRVKESNFPWLNINLMDENGKLLPGTTKRVIRDIPFTPAWGKEEKESRVCIFGAAYDVRETMFKDKERVTYADILNASTKEAGHLRKEEKCNVVLALTHQFSHDDCKMSKALGGNIDLILGGHDHSTEMTTVCGHAPYVKADSDLKTQWVMTLWLGDDGAVQSVDGRLLSLTDTDPFDADIHDKIVEWEEKGAKEMGKKIGCSVVDFDNIDAHSRQGLTNGGVFFTDAVRAFHKTDVALINGGTIRGNKVFKRGDLTKAKITAMHPFGNAIVKIYATGKELRDYIEMCLGCYQDVCGAFVQISGLNYTFAPRAEKGERLQTLVHPDGSKVKDSDKFTVAMSDYMLANSPMKHNKLYDMTTTNDAVPIVAALFEAAKRAGEKCLAPKPDGRIVTCAAVSC